MRQLLLIWRRELTSSFLSPVAYVAMAAYLLLAAATFVQAVDVNAGEQESAVVLLFVALFFWLPLFATAVTMRLFAEEKRSGTIESLMTAPVTDQQVVLGKFFGAYTFLLSVSVPAISSLYVLSAFSPALPVPDRNAVLGGILIFLLVSGLCVAVGLLVSMLTRNQIVAAICCFAAICLPFVVRMAGAALPFGSDQLLESLSAETHVVDFARGSIDSRPIVLYMSSTLFLLFTAVKVLETRRWR